MSSNCRFPLFRKSLQGTMLPLSITSSKLSLLMSRNATPAPLNMYSNSRTVTESMYTRLFEKRIPVFSGSSLVNNLREPEFLHAHKLLTHNAMNTILTSDLLIVHHTFCYTQ